MVELNTMPNADIRVALITMGKRHQWLLEELRKREIKVDKGELSNILAGRRVGPKADAVLRVAREIVNVS